MFAHFRTLCRQLVAQNGKALTRRINLVFQKYLFSSQRGNLQTQTDIFGAQTPHQGEQLLKLAFKGIKGRNHPVSFIENSRLVKQ